MPSYHDFVFNSAERKFVGKFEEMYQAEKHQGFDSWHQDDLESRFDALEILKFMDEQQFGYLTDIGCGKGTLTNRLSMGASHSLGLDISETAITEAASRYPNIRFQRVDINDSASLEVTLNDFVDVRLNSSLIVLSQVLSYLSDWRRVVEVVSKHATVVVIALYVPRDPIGYVKNIDDLRIELERHGTIQRWSTSQDQAQHVVVTSPKIVQRD